MIVYLDLETNFPDQKEFQDLGQMAVDRVTCLVFTVWDGANEYTEVITDVHMDNFTFFRQCVEEHKPVFVGHNICRFDAPVLKRLFGMDLWDHGMIHDTLLMSKMMYERPSHSLDSWYKDFGMEKRPLSVSLGDTVARCREDVQVTRKLYEKIRDESLSKGMTSQCFEIESHVARIVAEQHERGITFDVRNAKALHETLTERMNALATEVADEAGWMKIPSNKLDTPPKIQFKKDGTPSVAIHKYIERNGWELTHEKDGWRAWKNSLMSYPLPLSIPLNLHRKLDIGSSDEVKEYLLGLGWEPTIWNHKIDPVTRKKTKTSPKLFGDDGSMCTGLDTIPGAEATVRKIKEYLTIRNRRNVLASDSGSGWLNHTRVVREGLIGSDADTVGAVTGRFTHRVVANIPRSTSAFGAEIRALFTARPGYVMVGWDASSLEARMEAHYTYPIDGGAYAAELLDGDIHTKNQQALGLPTRAQAKTFKYAVTYGASAKKLASQFGWSQSHAEDVYQAFWDTNPALKDLHGRVQRAAARGYLVALDRRRIPVESMHSALNRLFQSAGAITMKYAMYLADREIRGLELDAYGLIRYHDEEQWEARYNIADDIGRIGIESIVNAGKMLKLNVPLTGEYKIGNNWAETH